MVLGQRVWRHHILGFEIFVDALWATLAGLDIPDRLPDDAAHVLRALSWGGGGRPPPDPHMTETLLDPPREGPIRDDLRDRLAYLAAR